MAWARRFTHVVAMAATALSLAAFPRYWPRTVRNVFARQLLFTGLEAVGFVSLIAALVGLSVVLQAQLWLTRFGQSALLGPLLVTIVVREVGPLLTNFIVIGRSGTAMASELASMRVGGEVRVLDAQGLDPFPYLVMPRLLGMALSVFCLTVVFIVVSFTTGFLVSVLVGAAPGGPAVFVNSVLRAVQPADLVSVLLKTFIPGLLTGAICCAEGLAVRGSITEIPQATTRGLSRSVVALFLVSALVSALTFLVP